MMDSLLLYKILKNRTGAEISASGNPATLPGTLKNNPMNEMKVYGWSKQERTTGAQLWDEDNAMHGYTLADGTVQNANKTNNEVIGWDAVENATSYEIMVTKADGNKKTYTTTYNGLIRANYCDKFLEEGLEEATIKVKAYGVDETFSLWSDEVDVDQYNF